VKRAFILVIGLLLLPSLSSAEDFILSGYTEAGKRSTADDYEDEDEANDYTYENYHLRLNHEISDRLLYDISSFIYNKDYSSKDSLDNISRILKGKWSYYIRKSKVESMRFVLRLKYKEKRYENSRTSEYNQIRAAPTLTFKKKDIYTVNVSAGIDNYDYIESGEKDQFKIFAGIGGTRYLMKKKLKFLTSYKIESLTQQKKDREKTKHDVMGGYDFIFDLPWVYKITTRANWGIRDTKEDDQRDEDHDYEYWRFYIRTVHRINPKLKTTLKYQYDYVSTDLDHKAFYIRNVWDYKIFDDKIQRLRLALEGEYKDVDYSLKPENSYIKEIIEIKAIYRRKKNWKAVVALKGNFYDYDGSLKDENRYDIKVSGEKLFFNGDLLLLVDLKYKYTDYAQKSDKAQEAVRVAFRYKF
jgi:hypothetical protein